MEDSSNRPLLALLSATTVNIFGADLTESTNNHPSHTMPKGIGLLGALAFILRLETPTIGGPHEQICGHTEELRGMVDLSSPEGKW